MKMTSLRFSVILFMALGLYLPPGAHAAGTPATAVLSDSGGAAQAKTLPDGLLKPDGTLKLDGSFSGALDLSNWNVRIDPERGPVFGPNESGRAAANLTASPGNWADLGGGGAGALNDQVQAVAIWQGHAYVGGWFQNADNIPAASAIAEWDGSQWSALSSNGTGGPSLGGGHVFALAATATDLYVAGNFLNVNDNGTTLAAADYVARWDGLDWHALGSNQAGTDGSLNGQVMAIAVSPTYVYVGGVFTNVDDPSNGPLDGADFIAKWDGLNWRALGADAGPAALSQAVLAIAVNGSQVYVGGNFTNAGGVAAADYVAQWDTVGGSWLAMGHGSTESEPSLNGSVYALAACPVVNCVYVGGGFSSVTDGDNQLSAAAYIAKWNGAAWSALGSGPVGFGSLNRRVRAIALIGTSVYAAGDFYDVSNGDVTVSAADDVARWDSVTGNWFALGNNGLGDGSISEDVYALAVNGSDLYVGGVFSGVNNNGTAMSNARYAAKFDTGGSTGWSALGAAQGSLNGSVYAIAVSGTDVYVGGNFRDVADQGVTIPEADYVARWDGSHWHALGSNGAGDGALNAWVFAIGVSGSDVYVGGNFIDAANLPAADFVAKWNGSAWSALGSASSSPGGEGSVSSAVVAIAAHGSDVYVGGEFTDINNYGSVLPAADYVARWDGSNWHALGHGASLSDGALNSAVHALAFAANGSDLYVGGAFTNAATLGAADTIAKWNGSSWSALGSGPGGDGAVCCGYVEAIAVSGSNVYVGGFISGADNGTVSVDGAYGIAKWDGSTWSALGGGGAGESSLNNPVTAIAAHGTYVYAGGTFTDVKNNDGTYLPGADYVARWDAVSDTWSALGDNGAGDGSISGPGGTWVYALGVTGTDVYVGGEFANVYNGASELPYADYVAAFGVISRQVSGNAGIGGATVYYTGGSTTSDATTHLYTIIVSPGWTGTVTPTLAGHYFTPDSRTYTGLTTDQINQNYTAAAIPAEVGGLYPSDITPACLTPSVGVDLRLTNLLRKNGSFDPSKVVLKLDGINVTSSAEIAQTDSSPANRASVLYTPTTDLALGDHLASFNLPTASGTITISWGFTVGATIDCTLMPENEPAPGDLPGSASPPVQRRGP